LIINFLINLSLRNYSMATYSEMMAQIEDLRKQAERQRKEEYSSVLKTIKKQIAEYGITAEELGFGDSKAGAKKRGRKPGRPAAAAKPGRKPTTKRATAGKKVAPKYKDEAGNTWTGRGKMPTWLAKSVAGGRTLESFLIQASA
jgi:DNA-binding protein H-NS